MTDRSGVETLVALVTTEERVGGPVLDIRQHHEFGSGHRAMGAASPLERAGHRDVSCLVGGPDSWVDTTGESLEVSS